MTLPRYEEMWHRADDAWARAARPARTLIKVGVATCSRVVGAEETLSALRREVEARGLDADFMVTGCLGLCYVEPLVVLRYFGPEVHPDAPAMGDYKKLSS